MESRKIRRNDVVLVGKTNDGYRFYGRVNRVLPDGKYEVIDCGKFFQVWVTDEIELTDYKGFRDCRGRWYRMPTLRKLKQMASYFNKSVWKKNRWRT